MGILSNPARRWFWRRSEFFTKLDNKAFSRDNAPLESGAAECSPQSVIFRRQALEFYLAGKIIMPSALRIPSPWLIHGLCIVACMLILLLWFVVVHQVRWRTSGVMIASAQGHGVALYFPASYAPEMLNEGVVDVGINSLVLTVELTDKPRPMRQSDVTRLGAGLVGFRKVGYLLRVDGVAIHSVPSARRVARVYIQGTCVSLAELISRPRRTARLIGEASK